MKSPIYSTIIILIKDEIFGLQDTWGFKILTEGVSKQLSES